MDRIKGKKILYLITQTHYGGAQRYLLDLAEHFKANNDVVIAVGASDHQDEQFFSRARSLGIEPIVIPSLQRDISLVRSFEALLEIRRLLLRERPDIVHINSSMAGAIGSCAAWLCGFDPLGKPIRVIYTVHGFVFNEPLTPLRKKVYLFIEKISASWKGALITVSSFDKDQGLKHKVAPDRRMIVVHNGIDPSCIAFLDRSLARNELGIGSRESLVLGTIASLYKTKGLETLIDALTLARTAIPQLHCIIVGEGPERAALERQIAERNLSSTVTLVGQRKNAAEVLKAFDAFVLPSVKEGFPYVLLEAAAARVPIVASRVGGIPELIENEKDGLLVEAGAPESFARAIEKILKNRSFANQLSDNLHEKVLREFTLDIMIQKTEAVYLMFYRNRTRTN